MFEVLVHNLTAGWPIRRGYLNFHPFNQWGFIGSCSILQVSNLKMNYIYILLRISLKKYWKLKRNFWFFLNQNVIFTRVKTFFSKHICGDHWVYLFIPKNRKGFTCPLCTNNYFDLKILFYILITLLLSYYYPYYHQRMVCYIIKEGLLSYNGEFVFIKGEFVFIKGDFIIFMA